MTDLAALTRRASDFTREYTYIKGDYAFGNERLPYYAVTMSIAEANQLLVLARDLVFDPHEPVRLDELFQRDLDTNRANFEIKEYLRDPHRVKFFSSFTVVLMPVDPGDRPTPLDSYPDSDPTAPVAMTDDSYTVVDAGPVQIRHLVADPNIGQIRWNSRAIRAVIIDGQHRFFAIHQLLEDETERYNLFPDTTRIPVLLLVLDRRAGYSPGEGTPDSVVKTSRQIFIDLNKNAEPVSVARQYLLDDRDLTAVAVRELLSDSIGEAVASTNLSLPLALVDWHSGQAKFETGFYMTTVLALYDSVEMVIDRPLPSSLAHQELLAYIEELEARLDIDDEPDQWDASAIRQRLLEAEQEQQPFHLTPTETRVAASAFAESLGALITVPLRQLIPYSELAERYRSEELLDGRLELWLGHDPAGKRAFEEVTGENPSRLASQIAAEVKDRHRAAFQVVFQKAIVRSMMLLADASPYVIEEWNTEIEPESLPAFAECVTQMLNDKFGNRWGDQAFWTATARTFDGKIDYSRPAAEAIAGLLTLAVCAPMSRWMTSATGERPSSTELSDAGTRVLQRLNGEHPMGPYQPGSTDRASDDPEIGLQIEALRWIDAVAQMIRPGPPPDQWHYLLRTACRAWRRQVEKYLRVEARTATDDALTDDQRNEGFLYIAARRLAAVAELEHETR